MVSEPGPSSSSQTVVVGMRLARPPRPCSTIRWGASSSSIACPSRPTAGAGRRGSGRRRRRPRDSIRVRWKSVRKWSVKDGRRARSAIASKAALARHVDLDLCADRAHRGAILFGRRLARQAKRATSFDRIGRWVKHEQGLRQIAVVTRSSAALGSPKGRRAISTSLTPTPGPRARRRPARSLAPERISASTAARSSRSTRTTACPTAPAAAARTSGRDSIFESMQDHGATTPSSRSRPRRSPATGWTRRSRLARCRQPPSGLPRRRGRRLEFPDRAGLDADRPQRHRRHPPRRPERLPPPRADRLRTADESLRVLDDRSLNGVFVNGEIVEWAQVERRRRAGDRPLPPVRRWKLESPRNSGHRRP